MAFIRMNNPAENEFSDSGGSFYDFFSFVHGFKTFLKGFLPYNGIKHSFNGLARSFLSINCVQAEIFHIIGTVNLKSYMKS